jgi:hypothetical protein
MMVFESEKLLERDFSGSSLRWSFAIFLKHIAHSYRDIPVRGGAFDSLRTPIVCEIAIWGGKLVSIKHISRVTTEK